MAGFDDDAHLFVSALKPARDDEQRQAELRDAYEQGQTTLEKQAALIKERYGADLEKQISVAEVEDTEIQALAVDHMANSLAAKGVELPQVSGEDRRRLADQAIEQAYKLQEAQQEQQGSTLSAADEQGKQASPEFGTTEWEAQAETAERQRSQDQRYANLQTPSASAEQTDEAAFSEAGQSKAEGQEGKRDRVAEFLKAEQLDREERKASMQDMMRDAGHEITEQAERSNDLGGGLSI